MAFGFNKRERLLHSKQFQFVFDNPQRVGSPQLTILFRKNIETNQARLGLTVAKKQFAKSVTRNRIKRNLREVFRKNKKLLEAIDIIFIPKKGLDVLEGNQLTLFLESQWQRLVKKSKE